MLSVQSSIYFYSIIQRVGDTGLQWHPSFSLALIEMRGENNRKILENALLPENCRFNPYPYASSTTSTHTHLFYLSSLLSLANAMAGILGLLLKATRRWPFFQNYSVLFCGHGCTFHSWAYSPHCCIQSKPLKNSYGSSSTKNT